MSTVKLDPEVKRQRIEELRRFHADILSGIDYDVMYCPKLCYTPKGKDENHISFFPSELRQRKDIYTEFTSREYIPEDPKRTLYRWKYNPQWEEAYEPVIKEGGIVERYLIPISELEVVSKSEEFELNNPDEDLPLDQLTIRDLIAILYKRPISKKKFVNFLINQHK